MRHDNNLPALKEHLHGRPQFLTKQEVSSLEERKLEELEFHNEARDPSSLSEDVKQTTGALDSRDNLKFYSATGLSTNYTQSWVARNSRGKVVLDFACGEGFSTIRAAGYDADFVVGIDISDRSLRRAELHARQASVQDRCFFLQADCEHTGFPADSFDTVFCFGMLHHLDVNKAYPELHRILKPGGKVLAVEAFGHNPFIQWYRNRTPELRTKWEAKHIIKNEDIALAAKWFEIGEKRHWHFCSPLSVVFRKTSFFKPALAFCNGVDLILERVPGLRNWSWQVSFEMIKR